MASPIVASRTSPIWGERQWRYAIVQILDTLPFRIGAVIHAPVRETGNLTFQMNPVRRPRKCCSLPARETCDNLDDWLFCAIWSSESFKWRIRRRRNKYSRYSGMYAGPMLRNYAHDFDFFVWCAEEFGAMCSNRKKFLEGIESHRCLWKNVHAVCGGYRQIRCVPEIDLVCLHAQSRSHIGPIRPIRYTIYPPIGFLCAYNRLSRSCRSCILHWSFSTEKITGQRAPHKSETETIVPQTMIDMTTL
jgi:hypothetical protein